MLKNVAQLAARPTLDLEVDSSSPALFIACKSAFKIDG